MSKKNLIINLTTIPTHVEIDGLNNFIRAKSTDGLMVALAVFFFVVAVLGVITFIFGPDSLRVEGHLSFTELWLLYPSVIVPIAILLAGMFASMSKTTEFTHINDLFSKHVELLVADEKLTKGNYHIEIISDSAFVVGKNEDEVTEYIDLLCQQLEQQG